MAANYLIQLLPTEEQTSVLIRALKSYGRQLEEEGDEAGSFEADELRLDILKKARESRAHRAVTEKRYGR